MNNMQSLPTPAASPSALRAADAMEPLNGGMRERPLLETRLFTAYMSIAGPFGRIGDIACITVSYGLSVRAFGERWSGTDTLTMAAVTIIFLLIAEAKDLYRPWFAGPFKDEVASILKTWGIVVAVLLLLAFVSKSSADHSRLSVGAWLGLAPLSLGVWRAVVRVVSQQLGKRNSQARSVAIIGDTSIGQKLIEQMRQQPWLGLRLAGIFDDRLVSRRQPGRVESKVTLGDLDHLLKDAVAGRFDVIYITLPLRAEPRLNRIIEALGDTTASVYVVPDHFVFGLMHAHWDTVGNLPVVSVFETPFHGVDGWTKRIEDLVIGTVILALVAIPMAIIAVGVKVSSPGPIFFRQRRYGLHGDEIYVLKFRTMNVCEDGADVRQALRDDPRTTRFGSLLRRTSLDELPQFLQVITGKMSIVGPRPHAIAHNEFYRHKIQNYMIRHKVKPGITGWAQVNGWRGETDTLDKMSKRVEYDLAYIRNWALTWDLRIILQTVVTVAQRRAAY